MGASLAVILEQLWLKGYEFPLRQEIAVGTEIQPMNYKNGLFVPMLLQQSNIKINGG